MGPQSFGEWVTLGSLLVAVIALVGTQARTVRSEHERDQGVRDKLDSIKEAVDRTQRTLERMDGKLDDHGTRLARVEEQISTLFSRVKRLEDDQDANRLGGTD